MTNSLYNEGIGAPCGPLARVMAKPIKAPLHVFDGRFYAKLGATCFVLGGCIETFMIKTGFYDKCETASPAYYCESIAAGCQLERVMLPCWPVTRLSAAVSH